MPAKLTVPPPLVSIAALPLLLTVYPGLDILIAQWVEHRVGAQLQLVTTRLTTALLLPTLNRLLMNRPSLFITRRQVSRPPVLREVPGPIGVPTRLVPILLNTLRCL